MPFPIETPRLILRKFCDSDLEPFFRYRNDPDVSRYQGWQFPYPREKAVAFIESMNAAAPCGAQGEWFQAAIVHKASGQLMGDVAFFLMRDDARQAYIGYTLAQAFWRQGYGTESMRSLLAYLFDELNLHRIAAECDEANAASWRLMEKLGMRREACFVENVLSNGVYGNSYQYAILKREWKT